MSLPKRIKYHGTIGDVNFIEYGGGPVFSSKDRRDPWVEYVEPPADDDDNEDPNAENYTVYRVDLERMKWMVSSDDQKPHLVSYRVQRDWEDHAPVSRREEWWMQDINSVMKCCDQRFHIFVDQITGDDPLDLAFAYQTLALYHGWGELDHYPLRMSEREVKKRYRNVPPRPRRKRTPAQ